MRLPRPRIRTVLLVVNLLILLLPLAGIHALRLYESQLVRETENSLLVLGAYVREDFRQHLLRALQGDPPPPHAGPYGRPLLTRFEEPAAMASEPYAPILPRLDLSRDRPRPRAQDARPTNLLPDPRAREAGLALNPLLQGSQRHTLTGIRVVDYQGIVVGSSRGELGLSLLEREEVRRALDGEAVSLLRERPPDGPAPALETISRGARSRIFVALPVVHEGRVWGAAVLSRTPLDLRKALYESRRLLLGYAAALLGVVLVVSILTATTISNPVAALIEQTDRIRAGEPAQPLVKPGSREMQRLSDAVVAMAGTLRDRAEYITSFARNVSHEFKTPLSTIHATVELLRDHLNTMTTAERERFLSMLDAEAMRLEALVARLLELARADTAGPAAGEADAGAVAAAAVARFRELGLAAHLRDDGGPWPVRMAPEALDSVLANLLDNCREHGGAGAQVRVHVRAGRIGDSAAVGIVVADDGRGISAANRARAFDPFFTTARERGGTGLGLSIVKSLVEAHGGSVSLESAGEGKGAAVTLLLPLRAEPPRR